MINDEFYIVDLPGYGFAKVPKEMKNNGDRLWKDILQVKEKLVFVLLDIRRVPSDEDIEMLEWLEYNEMDYKIIFTKIDKLSNNERAKQLKAIKTRLVFDNEDVFFHSSLTNKGRDEILNFMEEKLNN